MLIQRGGGGGGGGGGGESNWGSGPHWKITWLLVSFEILVRTAIEKKLDPSSPIASRVWFIQPFVKYVDD